MGIGISDGKKVCDYYQENEGHVFLHVLSLLPK